MLFAGYRCAHVLVNLEVHQAVNPVLPGEFRTPALAVLPYATRQIICHAGVKRSGTACEDVDIVALSQFLIPKKQVLRFAQDDKIKNRRNQRAAPPSQCLELPCEPIGDVGADLEVFFSVADAVEHLALGVGGLLI